MIPPKTVSHVPMKFLHWVQLVLHAILLKDSNYKMDFVLKELISQVIVSKAII